MELRSRPSLPSLIVGLANPLSIPSTQLTIYLKVLFYFKTYLYGLPHSLIATCHLNPNIEKMVGISFGGWVHIRKQDVNRTQPHKSLTRSTPPVQAGYANRPLLAILLYHLSHLGWQLAVSQQIVQVRKSAPVSSVQPGTEQRAIYPLAYC